MVFAAACSPPPDVTLGAPPPSDAPPASDTPPPAEVAWRRLAHGTGMLRSNAAAEAVESQDALRAAWQRYELPDAAPEVDFGRNVVLLVGQPDDACVDELIGLEVRDRRLRVEWLPAPGGCAMPLVFRIHAVEVDRRHLPAQFTFAFEDPYEDEAEPVTLSIDAVAGQAPPPPEPPRAMTANDLDDVFRGHAVRRCTKDDELVGNNPVDGPLSADREVAAAQRARAGFGVPSDEATTREVMASAQRNDEYGFPLLASELQKDFEASELVDDVQAFLRRNDYRRGVDVETYLSRVDGIRPGVLVDDPAKVAGVRQRLGAEFGGDAVLVVEHPYDFQAVNKAQGALRPLMGGSGHGSIMSSTGIPGPVMLGMIDPTREALDRIADLVDPSLVCVSPDLSGVATAG